MISEHNEIEAKLAADGVGEGFFKRYVMENYDVEIFKSIVSPDDYYESGPYVLRHRRDPGGKHELTVKRRKSEGSTRDREEIDLFFQDRTRHEDVAALLRAVGFTRAFTITKEAQIFWIQLTPNVRASIVMYDCWSDIDPVKRRFVECEVEKGSDVTVDTAKRHIRSLVKALQDEFKLGEPLNESLYEIYSGRRYAVVV